MPLLTGAARRARPPLLRGARRAALPRRLGADAPSPTGAWTYARNATPPEDDPEAYEAKAVAPGAEFLFDRRVDPGENVNLVAREPVEAERMRDAARRATSPSEDEGVVEKGVRIDPGSPIACARWAICASPNSARENHLGCELVHSFGSPHGSSSDHAVVHAFRTGGWSDTPLDYVSLATRSRPPRTCHTSAEAARSTGACDPSPARRAGARRRSTSPLEGGRTSPMRKTG